MDLFCGPGGFSEGFKKAGFDILLGIDADKNALNTFKYNHKATKTICENIRDVDIEKTEEKIIIKSNKDLCTRYEFNENIDVIIGGIPCNASSNQSNGKNKEATREKYSDLYKEYIRFVKEIRPKIFVIENVAKFLKDTDNNGNEIYEEIKKELGLDGLGYYINDFVKNIADYGVPQKRKRAIIIGSKIENIEFPEKLIKEDTWITVSDAISDLPEQTGTPTSCDGCKLDEYSIDFNNLNDYQNLMRENEKIFNHITSDNRDDTKKKIEVIPSGGNWNEIICRFIKDKEDISKYKKFSNMYNRLEYDKPAKTIIHIGSNYTIHPIYNRLLSVREGARIQGFDDKYIFKGGIDSQYQQIADAVSPIFSKCIAEKIKEYI